MTTDLYYDLVSEINHDGLQRVQLDPLALPYGVFHLQPISIPRQALNKAARVADSIDSNRRMNSFVHQRRHSRRCTLQRQGQRAGRFSIIDRLDVVCERVDHRFDMPLSMTITIVRLVRHIKRCAAVVVHDHLHDVFA